MLRRFLTEQEESILQAEKAEVKKPVIKQKKPGPNDPCWCGSGKKYKKCHMMEDIQNGEV